MGTILQSRKLPIIVISKHASGRNPRSKFETLVNVANNPRCAMHGIRNAATTWPQALARCRRIAKLAKRVTSDGASIGSQRVLENFNVTSAAEVEKAVGELQSVCGYKFPESHLLFYDRRKLRLELSEQNLDGALGTSEELRSLVREAYGATGGFAIRKTNFALSASTVRA